MVGVLVGVLFSGILVNAGVSSLVLFRAESKRGASSRQGHFLCAYIIALLFLVIAFEAQEFIMCNASIIFRGEPPLKLPNIIGTLLKVANMTLVVILGLTDGLLVSTVILFFPIGAYAIVTKVWRCFMVQRALGNIGSKWGSAFWIFPACLWGLAVGS